MGQEPGIEGPRGRLVESALRDWRDSQRRVTTKCPHRHQRFSGERRICKVCGADLGEGEAREQGSEVDQG